MATGSELRGLVRDDGAHGDGGLDATRIIRGAKRRRLPKQLAVGGATLLAVVAIVVPAVSLTQSLLPTPAGAGSSAGAPDAGAKDDGAGRSQPDGAQSGGGGGQLDPEGAGGSGIGACSTTAIAPAADSGLTVTVSFPQPAVGARAVDGTVTISNGGAEPITGWFGSSPTVIAQRDGRTAAIAVASQPRASTRIELAPGQSLAYPVTLPLVDCASAHPALAAGSYTVSASIQFGASAPGTSTTDGGLGSALVGGPTSMLTVR